MAKQQQQLIMENSKVSAYKGNNNTKNLTAADFITDDAAAYPVDMMAKRMQQQVNNTMNTKYDRAVRAAVLVALNEKPMFTRVTPIWEQKIINAADFSLPIAMSVHDAKLKINECMAEVVQVWSIG